MLKRVTQSGVALAALAALLSGIQVFAQHNTRLSASDRQFVNHAAEGGLAEVELGQLALRKSSSQQVKSFAQRMVTDHSSANDKLLACAQRLNMTLPNRVSAEDMALKTKLQGLSGSRFDRAYMDAMVKDHQQDIAQFQREASQGQNPQVKQFADKTLPTLQEHLRMAERTDQQVGGAQASSM